MTRTCPVCGSGFVAASPATRVCPMCHYKRCVVCGGVFYERRAHRITSRKYCSRECQYQAQQVDPKQCKQCGELFYKGGETTRSKFCSRACFAEAQSCRIEVDCETCGIMFRRGPAALDQHDHHFCSIECMAVYNARNRPTFVCEHCGMEYGRKRAEVRKGRRRGYEPRFCSRECQIAAGHQAEVSAAQANAQPNALERAGYAILDELNIDYEAQAVICDKFCVDAFLSDANIIIEWDGDYWHGNPDQYDEAELDHRQRKARANDKRKNAYLRACGYRVLRFWEHEVRDTPESVRARIAHAESAAQTDDTCAEVPSQPALLSAD